MPSIRLVQRVAAVVLATFIILRLVWGSKSWDLPVVEISPPLNEATEIPCISNLPLPVHTSDIVRARDRLASYGILKGDFSAIFRHVLGDQGLPWHEVYDVGVASKTLGSAQVLLNPHLLVAPRLASTSDTSSADQGSLLSCISVTFRPNEKSALATCAVSPVVWGSAYINENGEASRTSGELLINLISLNSFAANYRSLAVNIADSRGVNIPPQNDSPMSIFPVLGESTFPDLAAPGGTTSRLALLAESPGITVGLTALPALIRLHLWKTTGTTVASQMPDFVFDIAILSW